METEERPVIADDFVIDEKNFSSYFFNVKNSKPKRGQVIARYTSMAELHNGAEKKSIVDMLSEPDKAIPVSQFVRNALYATEHDSLTLPIKIATDLVEGKDRKVMSKVYKFQIELFFYTWKECVPKNDPHWAVVSLNNLDKFLDSLEKKDAETSESSQSGESS